MRQVVGVAFMIGLSLAGTTAAHGEEMSPKERCLDEVRRYPNDPELQESWNKLVPAHPLAIVAPHAGFLMGAGLEDGFGPDGIGMGWTAGIRAEVPALHPLWLSGRLRYFGGERGNLHTDLLAGLNFRTYEKTWIPSGTNVTDLGDTVYVQRWSSFCGLSRDDFQLLAGGKWIGATGPGEDLLALQAGIQSVTEGRAIGSWSLTGLWDPRLSSYGGQLTMGVGGPYGLPEWFYMDLTVGGMLGDTKAFWMTFDFGGIMEF